MSINNASFPGDVRKILEPLQVSLRILVWGPGETSNPKWFKKRTEVVEALRAAGQGVDEVFTSEELSEQSRPPYQIEPGIEELAQADQADLIIALVLESPQKQGGVYRELQIIAHRGYLREKVRIFLPDVASYLNCFPSGVLEAYRESHKIKLSWNLLETCERLRDMCISTANEERYQRMQNKLDAYLSSRGIQAY